MNTDDRVYAYNEVSGEVALVPRRFLTHPNFGKNLREVSSGKRRAVVKADVAPVVNDTPSHEEGGVYTDSAFEAPLEGKDD